MNRIFTHSAAVLSAVIMLLALAPTSQAGYTSATPPTSGPTVPGDKAALDRNTGIAYAPENAPVRSTMGMLPTPMESICSRMSSR